MSFKNTIFLSENYLRGFLKLDKASFNERLVNLSQSEKLSIDEIYYLFTKSLLDSKLFYELDNGILEDLISKAGFWGITEDKKHKSIDVKNINKKNVIYFSSLIQSIFNFLVRKHKVSHENLSERDSLAYIKLNIELNGYLNIMYDIFVRRSKK